MWTRRRVSRVHDPARAGDVLRNADARRRRLGSAAERVVMPAIRSAGSRCADRAAAPPRTARCRRSNTVAPTVTAAAGWTRRSLPERLGLREIRPRPRWAPPRPPRSRAPQPESRTLGGPPMLTGVEERRRWAAARCGSPSTTTNATDANIHRRCPRSAQLAQNRPRR